jgi:hypothetical protein
MYSVSSLDDFEATMNDTTEKLNDVLSTIPADTKTTDMDQEELQHMLEHDEQKAT